MFQVENFCNLPYIFTKHLTIIPLYLCENRLIFHFRHKCDESTILRAVFVQRCRKSNPRRVFVQKRSLIERMETTMVRFGFH